MKLVEIIRGLATGDYTYETTRALAERLGKQTVVSRDIPGFIVNRVLMPMLNEACFAFYEGIGSVEDMDTAINLGLNHPMGPFALMDLIGLDTTLSILEVMHRDLGDSKYRPCPLLRQYVAAGWLGRKTGRGFYRYTTPAAGDGPDPHGGSVSAGNPRVRATRAGGARGGRHRRRHHQPARGAQRAGRRDAGRRGRGVRRSRARSAGPLRDPGRRRRPRLRRGRRHQGDGRRGSLQRRRAGRARAAAGRSARGFAPAGHRGGARLRAGRRARAGAGVRLHLRRRAPPSWASRRWAWA